MGQGSLLHAHAEQGVTITQSHRTGVTQKGPCTGEQMYGPHSDRASSSSRCSLNRYKDVQHLYFNSL